jgi:UDP-N-acetylglucosamine 2-epimerase (non-hydrolysing)
MVKMGADHVQEETTVLGTPCLTVRENTERPITVEMGTNILVGRSMSTLRREAENIIRGEKKKGSVPPLWDGRAGERIADVLLRCEELRKNVGSFARPQGATV